jgi:hypothetical protein
MFDDYTGGKRAARIDGLFCELYKNASGKKEKVAKIPKNVSNIQIFDANIQMGK